MTMQTNAGAGYYSNFFSICCSVGKYSVCIDGGIATINYTIDKLRNIHDQNIVFLDDSQAAIILLINLNYNQNAIVLSCRIKIHALKKSNSHVAFQWIRSHCAIFQKEKADRLAKSGSLVTQQNSSLPLRNIKRIIRSKIIAEFPCMLMQLLRRSGKSYLTKIIKSPVPCLGLLEFLVFG